MQYLIKNKKSILGAWVAMSSTISGIYLYEGKQNVSLLDDNKKKALESSAINILKNDDGLSSKIATTTSKETKTVTTKSWTYYKGLKINDPDDRFRLFTGSGSVQLGNEVAGYLGVTVGNAAIKRFADGEVSIQVQENVRGKDVFILQSTSAPVNDNMIELLLMVSCMRRSSARRITVVMPYVAYARASLLQDKQVPISARAIAIMLETMGVDRVVSVDLHSGQIQGFFKPQIPTDNLEATRVGANYFADALPDLKNPLVVAIRTYSVSRAKDFRETLVARGKRMANESIANARLAMVIRNAKGSADASLNSNIEREGEGVNEEQTVGIELVGIANRIDGDVILIDDIIDTGRTLCAAAEAVKARGARNVYAFSTHGLFTQGALERIAKSSLDRVIVTNTVQTSAVENPKIVRLSLAPLLAETIRRIHEKESLSETVYKMQPNFEADQKKQNSMST